MTARKLKISPSRASDFMRCPQLYKFRVVDRRPEPQSEHAVRGSIVHRVLELLHKSPPEQRTLELAWQHLADTMDQFSQTLMELYEESFSADMEKGQGTGAAGSAGGSAAGNPASQTAAFDAYRQEIRQWAWKMIENYFATEDPSAVQALATEKWIEVALDFDDDELLSGVSLMGRIDRLEKDETDKLVVTDYKTGKAPSERYAKDAFFGLWFYALVLTKLANNGGESAPFAGTPARVRLMYLQSGQVLEDQITARTLEFVETKIKAVASAIARAHQNDGWRPNPGPLCNYCHFKLNGCPAFA
jgi:putative RecB family exonuclease